MPATTTGAAPADAAALRVDTGEIAMNDAAPAACRHQPACPPPDAADCYRAHAVASHPEQGWSLLCNGVIVFDDLGALFPGGGRSPSCVARGCLKSIAGPAAPATHARCVVGPPTDNPV
jgi:hypothetical protein